MGLQRFGVNSNSTDIINAIEADGAIVLEGVLNDKQQDYLDKEADSLLAEVDRCEGLFHGFHTKRVGGMVGKSKICQSMALNRSVLDVMDHFLLPNCDQYQLNLSQLISIEPGEGKQILHPDDPLFPFEHPGTQSMLNVMWAVDDFTIENGATQMVLGSHKWPRDRDATEDEVIQAEMPKGSCLIYLGSAVHGGGENRSNQLRRGLVISYCLGWLRQAENQYLAISREDAQNMPEPLQRLIGYFVHKPNLGMVDGTDPIACLDDDHNDNQRVSFQDFMPKDAEELLKKHYGDDQDVSWAERHKKTA